MDAAARPRRRRSWRGPPLTIRRSSSEPPMARASREKLQNLTIVYNIDGLDHYAVIPYPKSYEAIIEQEALTAAVKRFSQSFVFATPTRQVWLAKGLRTRRNRWIWAECDPETFMQTIEESAAEIRLCDNEQEGFDSDDDSDCLSVIVSEEDIEGSVQTNMTSLMHELDSRSAKSSVSCASAFSLTSPAGITESLIDDAIHIYHSTTDFSAAIAKLEHAASVVPASHPDLKAQCYLHLGYLAQITSCFPPTPTSDASNRQPIARSPSTPSFSTARSHFRHAHKLFTLSKNREAQLKCKQATASIALDEQDWDSARSQILYMLDAGKRDSVPVDEVWCASALALIALKQGVDEEADRWWAKMWNAGAR
ncbi:hypothetical protein FRC10_009219 [Ceratobasidium sp. 414]|nr:hypothetical protein FRC10_009219 [Ceratobasidium sp. 414]